MDHYSIDSDVRFGPLEVIDVKDVVAACQDPWCNQALCEVNDSVIRLGVLQGEFHWHKHDHEDEFFFVLDGTFLVDLEDETIALEAHQGYAVPKGVVHRTRAPERAIVLLVEGASVDLRGD